MNSFHKLKISDLKKPIADATTIQFDVPKALQEQFSFYPGQHLIIKFLVNGEAARRSYSLNSCPYNEEALEVTVKRVKGGLVSNFVNDELKIGDTLEVMVPQGRFYADMQKDNYKTYFLFAAGSGITPIFSILKSALVEEPNSFVYLFYGNAKEDTIIFKTELEELQKQYPNNLYVVHTLSEPKNAWTSWNPWKGRKGRIEAKDIAWFISNHPPQAQTTEYYICGPGKMNTSIRSQLMKMDVPKAAIHIEQFGGEVESDDNLKGVDNAKLIVNVKNKQIELKVGSEETILQVLKQVDAEPPYSCESGICGTCVAKVKKGKAQMKACMALDDKEVAEGFILTCQAMCQSEQVEIEY